MNIVVGLEHLNFLDNQSSRVDGSKLLYTEDIDIQQEKERKLSLDIAFFYYESPPVAIFRNRRREAQNFKYSFKDTDFQVKILVYSFYPSCETFLNQSKRLHMRDRHNIKKFYPRREQIARPYLNRICSIDSYHR